MTGVAELVRRIELLEARVAALETTRGTSRSASASSSTQSAPVATAGWTMPYTIAQLEVSETWIELHEASARPQLQRLLREVVDVEGPVTDRLALDRIRRAWGLRRAGGRVQEAFDQALRQLVARGLVERQQDALVAPGAPLDRVRVPGAEEDTRRGAEDVPLTELSLAIVHVARGLGGAAEDDVTLQVAKLFGWTRRGGAIQERLEAALDAAAASGQVARVGGRVVPA